MNLKIRNHYFILACLLVGFGQTSFAQIPYGSNNGKYLKVKNASLYYEEYGQGQPLLLLHGGMGSINNFKKVIEPLSKQFKVYAIDSPGQGRSPQIDSISYKIFADYYAAFIDEMKLDSAYVMGWSDGGNSAFILAHDRPDKVKKVVAIGANSDTDGYRAGMLNWVKSWKIDPETAGINNGWLAEFNKLSPNAKTWEKSFSQLKYMWITKEVISDKDLASIKSKILLLYGDKDLATLEHIIHLKNTIKGIQLCILPNTPHNVFDKKSEMVSKLVIDFLKPQ